MNIVTMDKLPNLAQFPNRQKEKITPTSKSHGHNSMRQLCSDSNIAPGHTQQVLNSLLPHVTKLSRCFVTSEEVCSC